MGQDYQYFPVYGIEPFEDVTGVGPAEYGGGSDNTGRNLLISLWTVEQTDPNGVPISGRLLRPAYADDVILMQLPPTFTGLGEKGFQPFTSSRTSFKFSFTRSDNPAPFPYPILATLNAPQELKTHLMQSARNARLTSTPPGFAFSVFNSLFDNPMWNAVFENGLLTSGNILPGSAAFSGLTTGLFSQIPYLITSGADGVYPKFYPITLPIDSVTRIEAVTRGDFFVACLLTPPTAPSPDGFWTVRAEWPHSVGRS